MFPQLIPIFASLEKHKVKYLVIGGIAVLYYGVTRMTKDVDLLIEPTATNAANVLAALNEAEFGTASLIDPQGLLEKPIVIFQDRVRVDVINRAPGIKFSTAWPNRTVIEFEGQKINLVSKADLIESKIATARPRDLDDVRRLKSSNIV